MKKSIIDSYREKFDLLLECCVHVQKTYLGDIEPKNRDHPVYGEFWVQGGLAGALTYFMLTLTKEEKMISEIVFARLEKNNGGAGTVDVMDFIEAGVEVMAVRGRPILMPEDE